MDLERIQLPDAELGVDDPVWDASVFSKYRDRLLAGEVAQRFLAELLGLPEVKRLLSSEHFLVDGTLLHVAQNITATRGSRIDARTTRHPGYAASLRIRKRIEEGFGWAKEIAGLAQVKLRGLARVDCAFVLGLAAYNLVRLPKLLAEASP